jgi:hypothetical protein
LKPANSGGGGHPCLPWSRRFQSGGKNLARIPKQYFFGSHETRVAYSGVEQASRL